MEKFTIKELLEVGAHYGHDVRRWNPKMAPYIYKAFNNVHIINLQKTAPLLYNALVHLKEIVAKGGRVLFVGTKRQASDIIKEYAEKCGQYYINHRWFGGTLTNWKTISQSIKTLIELEELTKTDMEGYTKKEQLSFKREIDKLNLALGGIRNMGGLPNVLFVIDSKKENIAIEEAKKLNIPVIAVVDTNGDPSKVDYIIPGNDDAIKAITFYCDLACQAVLEGLETENQMSQLNRSNKAKSKPNKLAEKVSDNLTTKKEDTSGETTKKEATAVAPAEPQVASKVESGE